MKNVSKILAVIIAVMLVLASCGSSAPLVVKDSETCIVITATKDSIGDVEMTLMDYMATLKEKGELEYSVANGMITSINGIENPADYSSCWMLYTGDEDNANSAWGTVSYNGNEYGSAVIGAEVLKVKAGCQYIWVFKSFNE